MPKCKPLPPCEVLEEWFDVDFATGTLFWKKKPARNTVIGTIAGWKQDHKGKLRWAVNVPGHGRFLRSRLIWKLRHGYDPLSGLDHKNGNSADDSIENLINGGASWNNRNRPSTAKSGYVGAYPTAGGRWMSTIQKSGKTVYLGTWDTAQQASAAYLEAVERFTRQGA